MVNTGVTYLTLYDRKNNYNSKYLALCESRCEYKGYDSINKILLCTVDDNNKISVYNINNGVKYNDIFE